MSKNDGGPAFPQHDLKDSGDGGEWEHVITGGMTLRDYFAAHALSLFCEEPLLTSFRELGEKRGLTLPQAVAKAAYNYADAMLAERDVRLQPPSILPSRRWRRA